MNSVIGIFAGFSAASVVFGIILGVIGNIRLSIGVAGIAVGIGVLLLLESTVRHGDGMGAIGQMIFGAFSIWAALLLLVVSFIVRAIRTNGPEPTQSGNQDHDNRA